MATSAGELIYTVDVDTAKAVTQARQAEKAVGALETDMNSAAAASAKLNTNLTATAKGVGQATTGMRGLSGVAGQIGFQLQDIAVQAQMGTSALTILGQQGSQVASVFGPTGAIVGAMGIGLSTPGAGIFSLFLLHHSGMGGITAAVGWFGAALVGTAISTLILLFWRRQAVKRGKYVIEDAMP